MPSAEPVDDAESEEPRKKKRKRKKRKAAPHERADYEYEALSHEDFESLAGGVRHRLSQGESEGSIRTSLLAQGYSPNVVNQAFALSGNPRKNSDVTIGIILLAIGLFLTVVTYTAASASGGVYIIATGPIAFGAVRLIRGLSR
ncbi:MAG: hypothetical protein R3B07_04480 [Polyangiaceae bacterium]